MLGNELKAAIKEYVDSIRYDIDGECYYFSDKPTSPAIRYGGTWEQVKDVFLLAAGDIYAAGSTGGEATHTLTVDELAPHEHILCVNGNPDLPLYTKVGWENPETVNGRFLQNDTSESTSKSFFAKGAPTGLGTPHNNMPPYRCVYVWRKISN